MKEYVYDYTDCNSTLYPSIPCSKIANDTTPCYCQLPIKLDEDYPAPVYLYYGLKNFYQNHRRYVKSRDDNQLLGRAVSSVNSECSPFDKPPGSSGIFYAPCGAIANSLFNDSFLVTFRGSQSATAGNVSVIATGIAWTSDKQVKFRNPANWDNTVKPVNWKVPVQLLSTDPSNTGYENEDLIVWMRTAALPSFRKFYRRVNHSSQFSSGLPAGTYDVFVSYSMIKLR